MGSISATTKNQILLLCSRPLCFPRLETDLPTPEGSHIQEDPHSVFPKDFKICPLSYFTHSLSSENASYPIVFDRVTSVSLLHSREASPVTPHHPSLPNPWGHPRSCPARSSLLPHSHPSHQNVPVSSGFSYTLHPTPCTVTSSV